ncbi:MAG: S46 family peptidase [Lysobacterales bacterium]
MWVPEQLPEIAGPLAEAGLQLDPAQLADLTGDPMGAVVSIPGCTASFVSPRGLVATNHNCAYGAIQLNSTPTSNLMVQGFNAAKPQDEVSAGPNARVLVMDAISDVTANIVGAQHDRMDGLARFRAVESEQKRLIAECEKTPGTRCTLYAFFGGAQYRLFRMIEIKDVRLAYAPPQSIGNYGGEVDNWMWPRHTGDFSFYRAYVGPDGKPAPFDKENVPFRPKRWLRFADQPLKSGDFVMVAGYPGRTSRYTLASQFDDTAAWTYPTIAGHYARLVAMTEAAGESDADIQVKYASRVRGWENTLKNYNGQLEGFVRIDAASRKRDEEKSVLARLREANNDQGAAAIAAHVELSRLAQATRATRERDLLLQQLTASGGLVGTGVSLYRNALERAKPDAERKPGYQQRDQERIEGSLRELDRRFVPKMDRALTAYWLREYLKLPSTQRVVAIDAWLAGNDDAAIARALERSFAATRLGALEERVRLLNADTSVFEASQDPFVKLAVAATPALLAIEAESDARTGSAIRVRPVYLKAIADYRISLGSEVYPDANSSLRITFGNVTGYVPRDGVAYTPFTTVEGMAAKATGTEPFAAPKVLLDAVAAKNHGGLADSKLGTLPVNFLSDLDITGGNSGSPVLDAHGRLVGLAFDGNWESVASNWVFDPVTTRMIAVDGRYIRWIMQEIYPAPALLREIGLAAD